MARVYVICEGQTEEAFVNEILALEFAGREVYLSACLVGTPGHKGGVLNYGRAKREILRLLKGDPGAYCTTMFDCFRLPKDFPGQPLRPEWPTAKKAQTLESAFAEDVVNTLSDRERPDRFLPYIQMHEFESLLFSDPEAFAKGIYRQDLVEAFLGIRRGFATPEDINEGRQTAPSQRVLALFPHYRKPLHGALGASEVGIQAIRQECPHFRQWAERLAALGRELS